MNIGERLSTKIGPLPVWAWGAIGAVVVWFLMGRGGPNALIGTQSSDGGGGGGAGPDRLPVPGDTGGGAGAGSGGGPPDPVTVVATPPSGQPPSASDTVIMGGQVPILDTPAPVFTDNSSLADVIYDTSGGQLNLRTHVYTPADTGAGPSAAGSGYDLIFGPTYTGPTSTTGVSGPGAANWAVDNSLAVLTPPVTERQDRYVPEPTARPMTEIIPASTDWGVPVPVEIARPDTTAYQVRDIAPVALQAPSPTVQVSNPSSPNILPIDTITPVRGPS